MKILVVGGGGREHAICWKLSNEKDVKEYVKSLDLNIGYINFNFGNKILDIIISEKYQLCKDKGIRFDIVADFSKLDFIDMMDLCVIFSFSQQLLLKIISQ